GGALSRSGDPARSRGSVYAAGGSGAERAMHGQESERGDAASFRSGKDAAADGENGRGRDPRDHKTLRTFTGEEQSDPRIERDLDRRTRRKSACRHGSAGTFARRGPQDRERGDGAELRSTCFSC